MTIMIIHFIFFFLSEHQELLEEIDVTQHREEREDLKLELERLVTRMEEKGAQITKLRKHWKMVCHDKSTLKHNFEVILLHQSNF